MPHTKRLIGWLLAGLIAAILGLNLVPAPAAASPLMGFTDTPIPTITPTPTPAPPSGPAVVDPAITKRVDVERAQVGDLVHYTLEVSNPNSTEVGNVIVLDPLPSVVDYIGTTTPQGTSGYDAASHTLTYNLGTLAAGQVLQITIVARVNSKGQAPDQFSNLAILNWDDGRSVTSNTVVVTIIPSQLPATGEGPGPAEVAVLAGMALAGLAGLGGAALGLRWLFRRRA